MLESLLQLINDNVPLATAIGAVGQFLAALFAAVAAGLSWRAIKVANEEAARSRKSFQYSWEPMLEARFETSSHLNERDNVLILPPSHMDPKYEHLSKTAQDLVYDFADWQRLYGQKEFADRTTPHPTANYLSLVIRNLQENTVGQAVSVKLLIEFTYADPKQNPNNLFSEDATIKKKAELIFGLERISPARKATIQLANITTVPALSVAVQGIVCSTWDNNVKVSRGICGYIHLGEDLPVMGVKLKGEEVDFPINENPIILFPASIQKDIDRVQTDVNVIGFQNSVPLQVETMNSRHSAGS